MAVIIHRFQDISLYKDEGGEVGKTFHKNTVTAVEYMQKREIVDISKSRSLTIQIDASSPLPLSFDLFFVSNIWIKHLNSYIGLLPGPKPPSNSQFYLSSIYSILLYVPAVLWRTTDNYVDCVLIFQHHRMCGGVQHPLNSCGRTNHLPIKIKYRKLI